MSKAAGPISRGVDAVDDWVNQRASVKSFYRQHLSEYWAPKNFNLWYFFGSLSLLVLVNQLLTGIFLTMHYKPDAEHAFASVEYIMRDVEWGWLIRYMHSTGASLFFAVVYLHMFRALMYGSYKKPRELVWILGVAIFLILMAESFMGYVLPWGQMSYWGAQVIISLFGAVPYVGEGLVEWIRGDYFVADATLNRFFALHVVALPMVLVLLVVLHLAALHEVGSNNPDGVDIKAKKDAKGRPLDAVPFHPYYTVKDIFGAGVFLMIAAFIVFFWPEGGGKFLKPDNFVMANPLVTPDHIPPVWYFTPFYAILQAIPDKLLGVITMGVAVLILFFVPWLDRSPVRSLRYRSWVSRVALGIFVVAFVRLGMLGLSQDSSTFELRLWTFVYFAFFILMPVWTSFEKTKPVPERVTS
ncbi:cytochrome b N-terminal domain-containing protein [Wenzhouxiangella limi]|uniref:Cytochrome b n=1 Tax=Wenzhouxiangella limi TaxID=2707351 RepID=A0A845V592_9GAMM|nr:cytochrome bc complex cytochrome b subunit [Wenzhouxiangella limi]